MIPSVIAGRSSAAWRTSSSRHSLSPILSSLAALEKLLATPGIAFPGSLFSQVAVRAGGGRHGLFPEVLPAASRHTATSNGRWSDSTRAPG